MLCHGLLAKLLRLIFEGSLDDDFYDSDDDDEEEEYEDDDEEEDEDGDEEDDNDEEEVEEKEDNWGRTQKEVIFLIRLVTVSRYAPSHESPLN